MTAVGRDIQALRRDVNDRIRSINERFSVGGTPDSILSVVCECATTECTTTVDLSLAAYDAIRAVPGRFVLADAHG